MAFDFLQITGDITTPKLRWPLALRRAEAGLARARNHDSGTIRQARIDELQVLCGLLRFGQLDLKCLILLTFDSNRHQIKPARPRLNAAAESTLHQRMRSHVQAVLRRLDQGGAITSALGHQGQKVYGLSKKGAHLLGAIWRERDTLTRVNPHRLLANRLLLQGIANGDYLLKSCYSERQLYDYPTSPIANGFAAPGPDNAHRRKLPDSLIFDPNTGQMYWIEVERTERSGGGMQELISVLIHSILPHRHPTQGLIARDYFCAGRDWQLLLALVVPAENELAISRILRALARALRASGTCRNKADFMQIANEHILPVRLRKDKSDHLLGEIFEQWPTEKRMEAVNEAAKAAGLE